MGFSARVGYRSQCLDGQLVLDVFKLTRRGRSLRVFVSGTRVYQPAVGWLVGWLVFEGYLFCSMARVDPAPYKMLPLPRGWEELRGETGRAFFVE